MACWICAATIRFICTWHSSIKLKIGINPLCQGMDFQDSRNESALLELQVMRGLGSTLLVCALLPAKSRVLHEIGCCEAAKWNVYPSDTASQLWTLRTTHNSDRSQVTIHCRLFNNQDVIGSKIGMIIILSFPLVRRPYPTRSRSVLQKSAGCTPFQLASGRSGGWYRWWCSM